MHKQQGDTLKHTAFAIQPAEEGRVHHEASGERAETTRVADGAKEGRDLQQTVRAIQAAVRQGRAAGGPGRPELHVPAGDQRTEQVGGQVRRALAGELRQVPGAARRAQARDRRAERAAPAAEGAAEVPGGQDGRAARQAGGVDEPGAELQRLRAAAAGGDGAGAGAEAGRGARGAGAAAAHGRAAGRAGRVPQDVHAPALQPAAAAEPGGGPGEAHGDPAPRGPGPAGEDARRPAAARGRGRAPPPPDQRRLPLPPPAARAHEAARARAAVRPGEDAGAVPPRRRRRAARRRAVPARDQQQHRPARPEQDPARAREQPRAGRAGRPRRRAGAVLRVQEDDGRGVPGEDARPLRQGPRHHRLPPRAGRPQRVHEHPARQLDPHDEEQREDRRAQAEALLRQDLRPARPDERQPGGRQLRHGPAERPAPQGARVHEVPRPRGPHRAGRPSRADEGPLREAPHGGLGGPEAGGRPGRRLGGHEVSVTHTRTAGTRLSPAYSLY